jgi:hypothetical protein
MKSEIRDIKLQLWCVEVGAHVLTMPFVLLYLMSCATRRAS